MIGTTRIAAITFVTLLLLEGEVAAMPSDAVQQSIERALRTCRPSEEEIRQNEKNRMKMPIHMRELSEVDYRLGSCNRAARMCRGAPHSTECRKFLTEMGETGHK